ncbi:hypothetical protein Kpol_1073p20 [Vanderwaltozyma polyspora DSM 70294]|uniref:Uncharacterized protein n=1 Tax=Vanderwaltozyma polyspora (strain ATCC 22028 / DSM 70294 / BCRC 21397 / CBS 2163 / NBRC 10782 / NRRL Y-8283 / UCD 57-17) TaxID=436907 RepID=A7TPT1_VANPO|nr:uncharacterized protein Kpol_1073p20 [Vanderwaltozyma polyspora DSM 70294]EDO15732.1 hypothetical protein Kpol_1073p20 [Vanderwaltozyma polyspora DSM 70294]
MEPNSSDNFEYVLQLTRILSTECRSSRQQTEHINHILSKVAKLSGVSYEQYSEGVDKTTQERYDAISGKSEIETLVSENYNLIYKIEQQDYMNKKVWTLINHVNEHINSIRIFLKEQKLLKTTKYKDILNEKIVIQENIVDQNTQVLMKSKDSMVLKINEVLQKLSIVLKEIDFTKIEQNSDYFKFKESLIFLKNNFEVDLTIPNM